MTSIWNYEPFYEFDRVLDALTDRQSSASRALQRSSNTPPKRDGGTRALRPRMDLHEDHKQNLVTATFELPGLKKDDVSIDINNNRLTVSGEAKHSSEKEEGGYAIKERSYGKFSRTLQLPKGVREDQIKAHMDNGVLSVQFPKSEQKTQKRITID